MKNARFLPKKILSLYLVLSFVGALSLPPRDAWAMVSLPITASSAVLRDTRTNEIFYAKHQHEKRPPASTTKILTSMVVMDSLAMDEIVTIPKFAEGIEASKLYVEEGERFYVRDLVKAVLMNSANDAAEVLAWASAGSRENFARKMNKKVREIGGTNSNFVRASGLPAHNQYSTANDLALIMQNAEKYPFLVKALSAKTDVITNLAGKRYYLKNHNKMLWRDSREIIGKTGWTRKAKHCFVGSIHVMDKVVAVSMLGSNSLWKDLKILVDFQFGKSLHTVKTNRKLWSREETMEIQTALKNAGFNPGSIDGKFGPSTVKAIRKFQESQGLDVDGIVGDETREVLGQFASTSTGSLKDAQIALQKAGYDPGKPDGIFGKRSRTALKEFQEANGLDPDGILGSNTWEKLKSFL